MINFPKKILKDKIFKFTYDKIIFFSLNVNFFLHIYNSSYNNN